MHVVLLQLDRMAVCVAVIAKEVQYSLSMWTHAHQLFIIIIIIIMVIVFL